MDRQNSSKRSSRTSHRSSRRESHYEIQRANLSPTPRSHSRGPTLSIVDNQPSPYDTPDEETEAQKKRQDKHRSGGSGHSGGGGRRSRASRHASHSLPELSNEYTAPIEYDNRDELRVSLPADREDEQGYYRRDHLEDETATARSKTLDGSHKTSSRGTANNKSFVREDDLAELSALPLMPPDIGRYRRTDTLETRRMSSKAEIGERAGVERRASNFTTQLYTVSYLILFSIFGTLARLGIQWLTFYPGAPVIFSELWANVGGSFIMGFLSNDTSLFSSSPGPSADEEKGAGGAQSATIKEPHPMHAANKKTIPLYIGLATGFCGSFTSFSSFMRDAFLALSNNLATPSSTNTTITPSRHNGYSVEALIAVLLTTTALSLAALLSGAHLALLLSPYTPTLPPRLLRRVLDPLTVFLALGAWLAALFMTIWPPDRPSGPQSRSGGWSAETWRGQALFACLFAPPGCLLRFLASLKLNALAPSFPLGTFAVNVFGTAVLGMAYDLQHVRLTAPGAMAVAGGGRIGCQVLQGIEDGFCGCVTTVSTWVAEMRGLRRGHAYVYGVGSVGLGVGVMVVVMGSVRWTTGFVEPICATGRG